MFAVVNLATAAVHANTPGSPARAKQKTGPGTTRRMPEAFAARLRHVGRVYPAGRPPAVGPVIDNAPWHGGKVVDEALAENPHLRFVRLPSYSPQLNPVERFWKKRRRATHNRLCATLADRKASLRASRSYFQAARHKGKSTIAGRPKRRAPK